MCRKNLNGFKRIVVIIPSLKRVKDVAGEARAEKYEKKGNYGRHLNEYLKKTRGYVCNVTSSPKKCNSYSSN